MCVGDWSINAFIFPFLIRSVIAVTRLAFLVSYRPALFLPLCPHCSSFSPVQQRCSNSKIVFFHQFPHFPFSLPTCYSAFITYVARTISHPNWVVLSLLAFLPPCEGKAGTPRAFFPDCPAAENCLLGARSPHILFSRHECYTLLSPPGSLSSADRFTLGQFLFPISRSISG